MKRLRSWLFVPGNSEKMLAKVPELAADAFILDLQDAVPPGEKDRARGLVGGFLGTAGRGGLFVRINGLEGGLGQRDLAVVATSGLRGVVLPLTSEPGQLRELDVLLTAAEEAEGLDVGSLEVVAHVETPLGALNALELARGPRVSALALGGEDYALALGTERTPDGEELAFVRSMIATAAAAAGVQAVDTVYRDYRDEEGLRLECARVRRLGFTGKLAVHPAQLPVIDDAFRPTPAEVAHARRVIEAFEAAGGGIATLGDEMIDAPVVERARRVLATACGEE